ncbi:MAG: hypothetical protein RJA70_1816, partial [Pseudomonadota bacterium]
MHTVRRPLAARKLRRDERLRLAANLTLLLGIGACAGDVTPEDDNPTSAEVPGVPGGGGMGMVDPGPGGGAGPEVPTPAESTLLVPGGALRRISVRSLHATLDRLFPELAASRPSFPPDGFSRFDTELTLDMGLSFVEATAVVMGDLVKQARLNAQVWSRIRTCTPTADAATCLGEFYDAWAPRLLRRPGNVDERASLVALAAKDLGDTDELLGMALETLLRHPEFTHRVELGEGTAPQRDLARHEIQSRLAYLLWGEAPDDDLRATSPADLSDAASRVAYAETLLNDPRARRQVIDYHAQWIGFATMPRSGLGQDMWEESSALVNRVVFEGVPYEQLFLSKESYLTPALAAHYGLPAPAAPGWTSTAGAGRLGLFGQGAFLQAYANVADTSPVKRGKNVLSRFLCLDIELPPNPGVNVDDQPEAGQCRVAFFRDTHATGACAGCHTVLDGVGFSLETFDKQGRARTHELDAPNCPLDGRGELFGAQFEGAAGLAQLVAEHPDLDACVAKNVAQFVLGVSPSQTPEGTGYVKALTEKYVAAGGDF